MSSGNGGANGSGHGHADGDAPKRVVITGIAGRLGRLLARRLHRDGRFQVIGIDRREFLGKPKDIEHYQVDLRSKKVIEVEDRRVRIFDVAALRGIAQFDDDYLYLEKRDR